MPKHGSLLISKEKAILGQLFTQLDIDRGFVSYLHDHSDTVNDTFGVAIFLEGDKSETYGDGKGQSGDVLLFEGVWNVAVKVCKIQSILRLLHLVISFVKKWYQIL